MKVTIVWVPTIPSPRIKPVRIPESIGSKIIIKIPIKPEIVFIYIKIPRCEIKIISEYSISIIKRIVPR